MLMVCMSLADLINFSQSTANPCQRVIQNFLFCINEKVFGEVPFVVQVGDFGLSKIKRNTLVTGGVRGTLPWMAPELLNGSSSKVSEKVR